MRRVWLRAAIGAAVVGCVSTGGLTGGDGTDGGVDAATEALVDAGADADAAVDIDCDDPSLRFFFHMDEGAGSVVHDCSKNKLTGLVVAAAWGPGVHGTALLLDGVSTCVDLGAAVKGPSGAFTFAAWVRVKQVDAGSYYLLSKTTGIADKSGYRAASEPPSNASLRIGTAGGGETSESTGSFASDTWIHVATVYDPSKRLEVWLDGVLAATHSPVPVQIIDDPGATLRVGCREGAAYLLGSLDDVRLYERALTPDEIVRISTR
jgi:hypothetical protein